MEVEVAVEGASEMVDAIEALPENMQKQIEELMGQIAAEGKDFMDTLTPVRSGYLKSRNQVDVEGLDFTLSNDCDYAPDVNYGTSRMHAQPFFEPTVDYIGKEMETVLAQVLEPS